MTYSTYVCFFPYMQREAKLEVLPHAMLRAIECEFISVDFFAQTSCLFCRMCCCTKLNCFPALIFCWLQAVLSGRIMCLHARFHVLLCTDHLLHDCFTLLVSCFYANLYVCLLVCVCACACLLCFCVSRKP